MPRRPMQRRSGVSRAAQAAREEAAPDAVIETETQTRPEPEKKTAKKATKR